MKTFPDKSVDLVLTDPPYGLDEKLFQGGSKNANWAMTQYKGEEWDKVPEKELFDEIFRVSKNQIIFGGNYFGLPPTRGIICWDKEQFAPNFSQFELAWTSFDKPAKIFRHSFMFEKHHPTMKPVELMRWCIENYSEEGMTILDPFGGSCTTAVACKQLKRNYICIEKEAKYVAICHDRLKQELLF
jgi:site-specific DNA-methyltransferase (adenine-specific)